MFIRWFVIFVMVLSCVIPAAAIETGKAMETLVKEPFLGDYQEMRKDGVIRVLMPYSITDYYIDNGQQKGLSFEYLREFETFLNNGIKNEKDKVKILILPTRSDQLISGLVEGVGDIAVGNLTITPERMEQVDFSDPLLTDVQELVVTAKSVPNLAARSDLAGMEIHVRKSASYHASLVALNEDLEGDGHDPVTIVTVDERLKDENLLEMLNTGIVPAVVMDDHKARLWTGLFDNVKIQDAIPVREGGEIAWAFRKDSPELKEVVNRFVAKSKRGTALGNILLKRYLSNINSIINPKTEAYQAKLDALLALFQKYGEKYNVDPLLLAAQAFQESRFNQEARSKAGAVGIMQLLPSTAGDKNVNIKNIETLENNIEAGAKYMRFTADHYFSDDDISDLDKILFVFASYNAGPNRVARVRKKAEDPNTWFNSVEWEVARAAGMEPVKYVQNIYTYYLIFRSQVEADQQDEALGKE